MRSVGLQSMLGMSRLPASRSPVIALHPETGQFFCELRRYLGLSGYQAAALLQTEPDVIAALETGDLAHLPAWPELQRIVAAYIALAGIDPAPALASLATLCNKQPRPQATKPRPDRASEARAAHHEDDEPRTGRWPLLRLAAVGAALAIIGLSASGSMLQAAMTKLPSPISDVVRRANDAVLIALAPRFEGMAWIDVKDPRTRRSDKLRKASR